MNAKIYNRVSMIGEYYYIIAVFLSFLAMYFNFRNGIISTAFILLILLNLLFYEYKRRNFSLSKLSFWVYSYVIYSLITIAFALLGGYNFSIITSEVANNIIPVVFYFYALKIDPQEEQKFEKMVILSCIILVISGIIYNINMSDEYYIAFLNTAYPNFSLNGFKMYPRLTSCVGSVIIGVLCNVTLCFAFRKFIRDQKVKCFYFLVLFSILGVVLSMQRSALVALAINLFGLFIYFRSIGKFKRKHLFIFVLIIVIAFLSILFNNPDQIDKVLERILSIPTAISERSNTWMLAFGNGFQIISGIGLGTGGHRAMGVGKTINDGNYFKMLYEVGIIGSVFFLIIVIKTLSSGLHNRRTSIAYLFIVVGMLLQAIGSNIFTFQLVAPLFWYCIGIIEKERISERYKFITITTKSNSVKENQED